MAERILITGASGFIGSFLVELALAKGFEVWAGIRSTSSRKYLKNEHIHFFELSLDNPAKLESQLQDFKNGKGKWEYIIHAAGLTKGCNDTTFFQTNYNGTLHLIEALRYCNMMPRRFVYLSSLSVLGAIREKPTNKLDKYVYLPIEEEDRPEPNTAYGRSKLATEQYLKEQKDLTCIIMRPTGVYGPREKDYFLLAKSIKRHVDFAVGYKPQEITFVYVRDLAEAIFIALEKGERNHCYFVSDGNTYSSSDFSNLLQKEMGIKCILRIKAPLSVLRFVCFLSSIIGKMTGHITALNNDKYNILKQRNWRCNIQPIELLGYEPKYNLQKGVAETVAWYKQKKWI